MPTAGDTGAADMGAAETAGETAGDSAARDSAARDSAARDSAAGDGPLITVAELADALDGEEPPTLLDIRWRLGGPPGIDAYRAGHLPGAVYVDLDTQLAGLPGAGGRHPLPAIADFEAAMRGAGVRAGRDVVVYDEGDGTIAARAWWLLRYFGHGRARDGSARGGSARAAGDGAAGDGAGQVRVLDGGYRAWQAAGQPVSTADVTAAPGDFSAEPGHLPMLDAAGAAEVARSGVLLDARAPARYRGETEPADPVAGHIPGALSAPTAENVTSAGLFRSAAELQARFASLGVEPGGGPQVGAYCGSGVTAAHTVLALELAGIPAALYVGSWSGWIADARPVATGPQPGRAT
ncbi:MAG TPA: sulfurtransferase [Streptosporangiaceae bacterium]|nr:sulfurtransferase [Streptosporangiaceae bacterium]